MCVTSVVDAFSCRVSGCRAGVGVGGICLGAPRRILRASGLRRGGGLAEAKGHDVVPIVEIGARALRYDDDPVACGFKLGRKAHGIIVRKHRLSAMRPCGVAQ